ncbi:MAG: helix-turn-helix transcriptional regulator [Actinophytocola sp.]|uniref:helix-turn-helix domain-containing protein n=1 Tax=Actinophytocola sp. TaxID=1872138 RepID=UPI003C767717
MDLTAAQVTSLVGEELLAARRRHGLSRRDLTSRLPSTITAHTLASYETGTRQPTVARLVEICAAMGESPAALLGRATDRYLSCLDVFSVDLQTVAADPTPRYGAVAAWAQARMAHGTDRVLLDPASVEMLAVATQVPPQELVAHLTEIANRREEVSGMGHTWGEIEASLGDGKGNDDKQEQDDEEPERVS